MPVAITLEGTDRGLVVTKALVRAAEALGLTAKRLAQAIGSSEPSVSRMKSGAYRLDPNSKAFELSVLLIRIFRSLDAIAGGDRAVVRAWMSNDNLALGGKPLERIGTITGMIDVLAYLDARRAQV